MENGHKSDFRKSCIKRLEFESRFSKIYKNKKIVKKLYTFIKNYRAKTVLLYVPMGIEVDVKPLINTLRREKIDVYVPYMVDDSFKVVKYRLPLKTKKFGIKEPNNSHFKGKRIDVAIVPVVGIDGLCKRLVLERECMIGFFIG